MTHWRFHIYDSRDGTFFVDKDGKRTKRPEPWPGDKDAADAELLRRVDAYEANPAYSGVLHATAERAISQGRA